MKMYLYNIMTDRLNTPIAKILKGVLYFFSILYGGIVRGIVFSYKIRLLRCCRLNTPVISIGNITLGGAGKTPLVEYVVRFLQEKGLKPAVLIRGYMADEYNGSDEAKLLESSLPGAAILVGANRAKCAQDFLARNSADVFVLDDGFQHWRIRRDLDIVAINTTNPFGSQQLIPRGILREPLSSLKRADIFILTKTEIDSYIVELTKSKLKIINPHALLVKAIHQPFCLVALKNPKAVFDLTSLNGKAVCSFCSIGDPDSFVKTLSFLNAEVKHNFAFLDHHRYQRVDIEKIVDFCRRQQIATVITTQKDAVKLQPFWELFADSLTVLVLKIKIEIIEGKEDFLNKILNVCRD